MAHKACRAVGDVGESEIDASGFSGGVFASVLDEGPKAGEGSGDGDTGKDITHFEPAAQGGSEGEEDEIDKELAELREPGGGVIAGGDGEQGQADEGGERPTAGGEAAVFPLEEGEGSSEPEKDLGDGDGTEAGCDRSAGGDDGDSLQLCWTEGQGSEYDKIEPDKLPCRSTCSAML